MSCSNRLNSMGYRDVLESVLFKIYGFDSVFVQDKASCHTSRSTLTYLDNKKVCMLADWPPQSPDANIIENLWSMLKVKLQKRCPKSQNELWEAIEQEFHSKDDSIIIGLHNSIPRRLQAILDAKGLIINLLYYCNKCLWKCLLLIICIILWHPHP